jgi:protein-glutamine gamma-glutamyltransferase
LGRTALLCILPAALIATGWRQLEAPPEGREIALVALLGVVVALLPNRWLRLVGAFGAFLAVAALAFGLSPLDARPFDDEHNFVGPFFSGLWNGVLDYYEVRIPFDPVARERMHGVLLLAAFGFTLAACLAIARRRPVLAAAITFTGAAWPVTLIRDAPSTARGALLLVAALLLLALLRPGADRGLGQTALVGVGVLVASLVAVSSPAVAKGEFLNWEQWEPYTRPEKPVSVAYVWDADYNGITFPKLPTTVLKIKAPRNSPYWRATTLDSFIDDRWVQDGIEIEPTRVNDADALIDDPLLPREARNPRNWVKQEVTVEALRDTHLVGGTVPVAFEPHIAVAYYPGVADGAALHRGQDYNVWSYIPQPSPRQLAASGANYPNIISDAGAFLGIGGASAPPFGARGRDAVMRDLFARSDLRPYRSLYDTALRVVGRPRNPYAAVVALEAWFRQAGNFRYDEHPPVRRGVPPLVSFVEGSRRGYCQHFAGAMALMLRYLGIPARVAAGFTTGLYNQTDGEWTVADTNAHTWVEVWFDGYGWLPFDPTPGRGRLRGSYTSSSLFFDVSGATSAFAGAATAALGFDVLRAQLDRTRSNDANGPRGVDPGGRRPEGRVTGSPTDNGRGGGSLIALLLLVGAALTGMLAALKFVRRRARYFTQDPRRVAAAVRRDLVDYLVDQGVPVAPSSTPADVGVALERSLGVRGDRLADTLAEARYGPAESAGAAADQARRELRAVRRGLRRRLGTWAKLRGLVSLRSLGLGSA